MPFHPFLRPPLFHCLTRINPCLWIFLSSIESVYISHDCVLTVVLQVRSFEPAPSGGRLAVHHSLDNAYGACRADVESCRPRDPFEEIFRGIGGPSSSSLHNFFDSDPFFRNDPFLRLAATPPSALESPRILDQVFTSQMNPPPQMRMVQVSQEQEDDFTCLFKAIDGMMDSAMQMALAPPPPMERITITFGLHEEQEEDSTPAAPRNPTDTAVSLLDSMVDGLLDHAASASASASNDVQDEAEAPAEQNEAKNDVAREEAARADILHARSGRSRPSNDEGAAAPHHEPEAPVGEAEVRAPSAENPFHPTWDPVVLARKIAEHGRDILADEKKTATAGRDGDLRRRLTEEDEAKSEVRRSMARRLTEVVPFGHLTVVPMSMMLPPTMIRLIREADDVLPPRLGFGLQTDQCLWSLHREEEGVGLSHGCSDALEAVEQSLKELEKEQSSSFVQQNTVETESPTAFQGATYRFAEFVQMHPTTFWALWGALVTFLLACACGSGDNDYDEEEYEEFGDASDYVLVQDVDNDASDEDCVPAGAEAFVGVPLRVV